VVNGSVALKTCSFACLVAVSLKLTEAESRPVYVELKAVLYYIYIHVYILKQLWDQLCVVV